MRLLTGVEDVLFTLIKKSLISVMQNCKLFSINLSMLLIHNFTFPFYNCHFIFYYRILLFCIIV